MTLAMRREMYQALNQSMEERGFRRHGDGAFSSNGLLVRRLPRWLVIQSRGKQNPQDVLAAGGRVSLWKPAASESGQPDGWEFHLPLKLFQFHGDDSEIQEEGVSPMEASIRWALGTAEGELPEGWESPPLSQVESWIPTGHLSVQNGPFLSQGSVIHRPDCLALSFPIVHELAADLSAARRDWLRSVLVDSQRRLHMVRIVLAEQGVRPAVSVSVDMSGAPHVVLEDLFRISLDALRWAVEGLLWPVGFLSDPRVKCQVWETAPADLYRKEK